MDDDDPQTIYKFNNIKMLCKTNLSEEYSVLSGHIDVIYH